MFFRKKGKYADVEGYNRISRLIEDRQREMSEQPDPEDDFEDESVLLTREPVPRDRTPLRLTEETPTVSSVRPVARLQDEMPVGIAGFNASANIASANMSTDDRRIPFQTSAPVDQVVPSMPMLTPPPALTPAAPAAPAMRVPELAQAPVDGCLVAAEAVWEGKLVTSGNVRVEGTLRGEVETTATLTVAAKARIEGTIHARSIVLAGEIEGQVICSDRLEILPGGSARGEIETGTLVVHEGAFIDSRFQMRRAEVSALR